MDRVTGYINDINSPQNICARPQYGMTVTGETPNYSYTIDILPNKEEVPLGEQPDDWNARYMDSYYYNSHNDWVTGNYTVPILRPASDTWSFTTQYYKDTETQILYFTGSLGFFGVSRYFYPIYTVGGTDFLEAVCVGLPFGIGNISGISE